MTENFQPKVWPGNYESRIINPVPYKNVQKESITAEEAVNWPDTLIDWIENEKGKAFFVSVRGNLKRYNGLVRQDSGGIFSRILDDGRSASLVVISDGVGSRQKSHYGSLVASRKAIDWFMNANFIENFSWSEFANQIVSLCSDEIYSEAHRINENFSDLRCTLRLIVVISSSEENRAYALSVGDGDTFRISKKGDLTYFFLQKIVDDGEAQISHGITEALPDAYSMIDIHETALENGEVVVVLTDGAGDVWFDEIMIHSLLVKPDLNAYELAWRLDIDSKGNTDDRTIAAWRIND